MAPWWLLIGCGGGRHVIRETVFERDQVVHVPGPSLPAAAGTVATPDPIHADGPFEPVDLLALNMRLDLVPAGDGMLVGNRRVTLVEARLEFGSSESPEWTGMTWREALRYCNTLSDGADLPRAYTFEEDGGVTWHRHPRAIGCSRRRSGSGTSAPRRTSSGPGLESADRTW